MQESEFNFPTKEDIEAVNKAIDSRITALEGGQSYNIHIPRDYSWEKILQAIKDIGTILISIIKGEYYEL